MEAVYGVAKAGRGTARRSWPMCKAACAACCAAHDKPYAIFEPFGGRPDGTFDETEAFVLDNIAKVAEGQRRVRLPFRFLLDRFLGRLPRRPEAFRPAFGFPTALTKIRAELAKLGTAPGLWIDSSGAAWSIGGNPAVQATELATRKGREHRAMQSAFAVPRHRSRSSRCTPRPSATTSATTACGC